MLALRPGDPFERHLTELLLEHADQARTRELTTLIRAAGVAAGTTTALCLGANPEAVAEIAELLLTADDDA